MPVPPAGASMSDDGVYWWDDANQTWQLVDDTAATDSAGLSGGTDPAGQLSEDGQYRWDGGQWQPVAAGDPAGTAAGTGDTVELPADLIEELNHFTSYYPELTALYDAQDGDTYLRTVVGIEPPTQDDLPVS